MDFLTQRLAQLLLRTGATPSPQTLMDENMRVLERIRDILADSALDDFECVEQIVQVMETLGIACGDRYDFG